MQLDPSSLSHVFQQPKGWEWRFLTRGAYEMRYGFVQASVAVRHSASKLVVICPGLSEFCEKYFELAHDLTAAGHDVLVVDWIGQGLSSRYLDNPDKRHSQGFDKDAHDLYAVLLDAPFDVTQQPAVIMGHSMGGNIALRFLDLYPDIMQAAALSAPLIGLHVFEHIPDTLAWVTSHGLKQFAGESYAPMGGDWEPHSRDMQSHIFFSSDPKRAALHNFWMRYMPALQVGHVTNKWISDAYDSCLYVQKKLSPHVFSMPVLLTLAGHEQFVDNGKIRMLSKGFSSADLVEFPQSRHEIWMERDETRSVFLEKFLDLLINIS